MRWGLHDRQERCGGRSQAAEKNQAQRVVMRVERYGTCCAHRCLILVSSVWLPCSSTVDFLPRKIVRACPEEWSSEQEVHSLRHLILERLLHDADQIH